MATSDMFTSTNEPSSAKAPDTGLLVTNHLNLMYMLAAGLVLPPGGFGDKYYQDTLECYPGWIPLFIGNAPKAAIESVVREAGHLKPAIVRVRLTGISGPVMAVGDNGLKELRFPDQFEGTERVLLLPAPLPSSLIESIHFRSPDDKRSCEADARDFGNVPMEDFRRDTRKKTLFTKASNTPWPPAEGPAKRTAPLQQPLAAGGVMAMLLLFGNLGEQAVRACQVAFDPDDSASWPTDDHPMLIGLGPWIREGAASQPAFPESASDRAGLQAAYQSKMLWEAVERLVAWRNDGRVGSAENVLIDQLSVAASRLDSRFQAGVRKLLDTLESLTGLANATASELFERHDTPLSHAMTLFFLRRNCSDLFDYASDQLTELDWLAAAVLFGVRDGWTNLPVRLRAGRELSDAVSHRMARLSHRIAGTGLGLGETPSRVRPLRELFGSGSTWRSSEKSAALALIRARNWDCVHTRIKLGTGDYRLVVKAGSTYLEVPGELRTSAEVDLDRFLESLACSRLDQATETKIRKKLGS